MIQECVDRGWPWLPGLEILHNFEKGATPHVHFALSAASDRGGADENPHLTLGGLLSSNQRT